MDLKTALETAWAGQVIPVIAALVGLLISAAMTVLISYLNGQTKQNIIAQTVAAVDSELAGQPGDCKLLEVLKRLGADPRVKVWTQQEIEAAVNKLPPAAGGIEAKVEQAVATHLASETDVVIARVTEAVVKGLTPVAAPVTSAAAPVAAEAS